MRSDLPVEQTNGDRGTARVSLDGRSGSMTSLTCKTHMFVFVFLNSIYLSKEGCHDYLDADKWGANLTDTFNLMTTKDPKDTLHCTLEAACLGGRNASCMLLSVCFSREDVNMTSPECEGESSQKIHFFHFMCLMAKTFNHTSIACEYDTVCQMFPQPTALSYDDLTTTPLTTTTILAETTKATSLSSPTKTAITTLEPTTTPPEKTTSRTNLDQHKDKEPEKTALFDKCQMWKYLFGLSLLFNVILAVYLYMRHRGTADRWQRTLSHKPNGNVIADQTITESDAQQASTNQDAEIKLLSKV